MVYCMHPLFSRLYGKEHLCKKRKKNNNNPNSLEAAYGTGIYTVFMARVDKQFIRWQSSIER